MEKSSTMLIAVFYKAEEVDPAPEGVVLWLPSFCLPVHPSYAALLLIYSKMESEVTQREHRRLNSMTLVKDICFFICVISCWLYIQT